MAKRTSSKKTSKAKTDQDPQDRNNEAQATEAAAETGADSTSEASGSATAKPARKRSAAPRKRTTKKTTTAKVQDQAVEIENSSDIPETEPKTTKNRRTTKTTKKKAAKKVTKADEPSNATAAAPEPKVDQAASLAVQAPPPPPPRRDTVVRPPARRIAGFDEGVYGEEPVIERAKPVATKPEPVADSTEPRAEAEPRPRRRTRSRKKTKISVERKPEVEPVPEPEQPEPAEPAIAEVEPAANEADASAQPTDESEVRGKPRRRSRRRRGKKAPELEPTPTTEAPRVTEAPRAPEPREDTTEEQPEARPAKRRSRRRRKSGAARLEPHEPEAMPADVAEAAEPEEPAKRESPVPIAGKEDQTIAGKIMLINIVAGEECRIAVLDENRRLEELYMERASSESHVGNIYKGRVVNIEPSIQAAFVDFGPAKHGFLHVSDLHPKYFGDGGKETEDVGRKTPRRDRPLIQKSLRRGQEVIVQIIKEGIGTKGPTLTTYLSVPGRYLVMMPGMSRLGVSRKIEEEEDRRRMRQVLDKLNLPKDLGFILRTAGLDRTQRDLQSDLNYLTRLWRAVEKRHDTDKAPAELYRESDLVIRTIRDVVDQSIARIIVDDEATAERAHDFLAIAMPRGGDRVVYYNGTEPLFHKYNMETEIEKIYSRQVPLPCGGSLVIDQTEALVAIDVNSGRSRRYGDAEEAAFRLDLEAADEIARQLRLRDLGGLVVCDFVDLRLDKHCRAVEKQLRDGLKKHKERAEILRMSRFGIIEMTRQRRGPALARGAYQDCPFCSGSGLVKTPESMTLDVMRILQLAVHKPAIHAVEIHVSTSVAFHLLNRKRREIASLERQAGKNIVIRSRESFGIDQMELECVDSGGRPVTFLPAEQESTGVRR